MDEDYIQLSDSDSDIDNRMPVSTQRGRKNIRNIKELEDLSVGTILANKNEKERIRRIEEKEKKFECLLRRKEYEDQLILDYDFKNEIPLVTVHSSLVQKLKSHQKEGVKFMWNACFESLDQIKTSEGSGCIIAHCMGLGKTFQVITLVHTLLRHEEVGIRTVLICCPKNTLQNWINEFHMWITFELGQINVYNPTRFDNHTDRLSEVSNWQLNGGVCVINYELFRILLENEIKSTKQFPSRQRVKFKEYLSNPGPDLVICDEGHVLKNEETKLSKIMSKMRTMRRIVLTGTPMQNNLKEYHCMVQFVKPNLLGTRNEFLNMFVNPILNGQYENSLVQDVQLMKERSHILHKKLLGCVQRFDLTTLKKFLPEKQEYVVSVTLTDSQIEMYRHYLESYSAKKDWKNRNSALFGDYQSLQRIWTHPYTLKIYKEKHEELQLLGNKKVTKKRKKESDTEDYDSSDSTVCVWRKCPLSWWAPFISSDDVEDARQSNKLRLLLKILKECEDAGEKVLVFSGSLYSLEMIERFLKKINQYEFEDPYLCNLTTSWEIEQDYLVLTGQTSTEDRDRYCKIFNNIHDTRLRLFLISTKAGGMGINLTAASRAILFDVSWNPSHDIQSIFRIYRLGQTKPCFIYRFLAYGTMEEKMYERQVAKQSISYRVVDEKQIARHYTERELLELYQFEPNKPTTIPNVEPKDPLLRKILKENSDIISGIHEHDSLLEHKVEEELHEEEKKDAWSAYNSVSDFENLPEEKKEMFRQIRPDLFDLNNFRIVLEEKYVEATKEEIDLMIEQLMPRITELLNRSDFIEIMKNQAVHAHNKEMMKKRLRRKYSERKTFNKTIELSDDNNDKENIVDLTATPGPSARENNSDSDDAIFVREIRSNKKLLTKRRFSRKPVREWGSRCGRDFGWPDSD